MNKQDKHLENLNEIRSIMDRSSRFLSLSGLSGVFAGIFALLGVLAFYSILGISIDDPHYYVYVRDADGNYDTVFLAKFFAIAIIVLVLSFTGAALLSMKNAKKKTDYVWDNAAKRTLVNLMIPLVTGGLFALVLLYHGLSGFLAPVTLIFYGLALLNASKYTLNDIRYLGLFQIILGLAASVYTEYGLILWALGFGVLHIIYGLIMYKKYEA